MHIEFVFLLKNYFTKYLQKNDVLYVMEEFKKHIVKTIKVLKKTLILILENMQTTTTYII